MICSSCAEYDWEKCYSGPCPQFWTDFNVIGIAYPINTECKEKKNLGNVESNKTIKSMI